MDCLPEYLDLNSIPTLGPIGPLVIRPMESPILLGNAWQRKTGKGCPVVGIPTNQSAVHVQKLGRWLNQFYLELLESTAIKLVVDLDIPWLHVTNRAMRIKAVPLCRALEALLQTLRIR